LVIAASQTVNQTTDVLQRITDNIFNLRSILVLVVALAIGFLAGRLINAVILRSVEAIGRQADKSSDLRTVNRLRRYETFLILSSALVRAGLLLFAFYFWWVFMHPSGQPTAIIGASALAVILLGGVLGPVLRDLAAGSFMMAEQWYAVGDYIKVEGMPPGVEGVVEKVTLRSTRIRSMSGEIIWVNNQNIAGVRLTPKGIRTIGLELFVDDAKAGEKLIEAANKRLPMGPLLVITPLTVVSNEKVGDSLWHITAIGETAPGREWLIESSAVELIKSLDENSRKPVIAHGPLFRFADAEAENSFRRIILNARKRPKPKKQRPTAKKKRPV
jgi:small conductance mechanosensitive channel